MYTSPNRFKLTLVGLSYMCNLDNRNRFIKKSEATAKATGPQFSPVQFQFFSGSTNRTFKR